MKNPIAHLSNLQQRTIAGLIGAALLIGGILLSGYTFVLLMFALSMLCLNEFYKLLEQGNIRVLRDEGLLCGAFILITLIYNDPMFNLTWIAPVLLFALFILELFKAEENPFSSVGHTILGLVYTILPFGLLIMMSVDLRADYYDPTIMIGTMLLVWSSDIGGYFAGVYLGKHKLFERISPKKTWEGAAGSFLTAGLIGALLLPHLSNWLHAGGIASEPAVVFGDFKRIGDASSWSALHWVGLAFVVVVFGILGDLVESMLKRSLGVKDSGNSIPGHGGFLDRFDALIFVIPFVWAYLMIL